MTAAEHIEVHIGNDHQVNLAYRWFCRLSIELQPPRHIPTLLNTTCRVWTAVIFGQYWNYAKQTLK
jgi:hypothetical protein